MLSATTSSPTVAGIGSLSRARMVSTVTVIGCNASVAVRTAERIPHCHQCGVVSRNSLHRPWPLSLVGLGPPGLFPRRRRAVRVSCDRIARLGADVGRSDVNRRYSTRRCNHSWRLPPTIMPGSAERYVLWGSMTAQRSDADLTRPIRRRNHTSTAIADVNFSAVTRECPRHSVSCVAHLRENIEFDKKGNPLVTKAPECYYQHDGQS